MVKKMKMNKGVCHPRSEATQGILSGCDEMPGLGLKASRHDKRGESGRSMVEMLGVLTIIGVLSVGGIIGLRQALTNARANDLIYEANKRATVVSGQLMFSNGTPSLSEFVQNEFSFGTFNSVTPESGTFTISITGVSEAVCAKAQSMSSGMIVSFTPQACSGDNNTVQLTYNNDLSEGIIAGALGTNAREPRPEDGPTADDGSTCTGERKGECQVCNNGVYVDSDALCSQKEAYSTCVDGTCKNLTLGCITNSDCASRQLDNQGTLCTNDSCYCNFNNGVNSTTGPIARGTCWAKSYSLSATKTVDEHEYIIAKHGPSMNWFSAKNFCAAYGKRMMTLAELGCQVGVNCKSANTLFSRIEGSGWVLDLASTSQAYYIKGGGDIGNYTRNDGDANVICY